MSCGAPLPAISQPIPAQPVQNYAGMPPPQPNAQKTWWTIGIVGCLLLGAFGFGYGELLRQRAAAAKPDLLRFEAKPPSPDLLRLEPKPQELTRREGSPAPENTEMPADIKAWLEHLEKTERERRRLSMRQIGSFTATMAGLQMGDAMKMLEEIAGSDPNSNEDPQETSAVAVHKEFEQARTDWRNLRDQFNAMPPPAECEPIRQAYEVALSETSGMMGDLMGSVEKALASDDPQAKKDVVADLYEMKGASEVIDQAGKKTDGLIQEICDKYKTKKWFGIAEDFGGGGGMMGGMGGF